MTDTILYVSLPNLRQITSSETSFETTPTSSENTPELIRLIKQLSHAALIPTTTGFTVDDALLENQSTPIDIVIDTDQTLASESQTRESYKQEAKTATAEHLGQQENNTHSDGIIDQYLRDNISWV